MKRILIIMTLIAFLSVIIPAPAYAFDTNAEEIIQLDDGGFIVVSISSMDGRSLVTKNGSKSYTYYANDGTMSWKAVLSGTFTYDGTSSTCTQSSCAVTIYESSWYTVYKTAGKSGNQATGEVIMGRKLLGVTVDSITISFDLTCDANGNLS